MVLLSVISENQIKPQVEFVAIYVLNDFYLSNSMHQNTVSTFQEILALKEPQLYISTLIISWVYCAGTYN
jgi:hypothetical protein